MSWMNLLEENDGLALDVPEAELPGGGQCLAEEFPAPPRLGAMRNDLP